MKILADYTRERRPTGRFLLHKHKPLWIVKYGNWRVFKAIEKPRRGAPLWTANNVSLNAKGFDSLLDALIAADKEQTK